MGAAAAGVHAMSASVRSCHWFQARSIPRWARDHRNASIIAWQLCASGCGELQAVRAWMLDMVDTMLARRCAILMRTWGQRSLAMSVC